MAFEKVLRNEILIGKTVFVALFFLALSTLFTSYHLGPDDYGFTRRGAVEGEGGAVVDVSRVGVGVEEAARLDAAVHLALHLELS